MTAQEGNREHVYVSLVMAPVLGLLYVIALPFIAIGTVAVVMGKRAAEGLYHVVGNLVSFGWRPMEAHLAGKKKERKRREKDSSK
jgi:hypothetical protein